MADNTANDANVADAGAHDRVAMLSLKADGTPDQRNPEIIGAPEPEKAVERRPVEKRTSRRKG